MNLKDIINVNLLSQQTQQKLAEFLGGLDHTIEIHVLPEIAQHAEELQNEQADFLVHVQPLLRFHFDPKSPALRENALQFFFRRKGKLGVQTAHVIIRAVQKVLSNSVHFSQIKTSQTQIRMDAKGDSALLQSGVVAILAEEKRTIHQNAAVQNQNALEKVVPIRFFHYS